MLDSRERDVYNAIKGVADQFGLKVMIKMRLGDMIEPTSDSSIKYNSDMKRIADKSCDFVVCNNNNNIVAVIDLENEDKEDTDTIDFILDDCGVKILRYKHEVNLTEVTSVLKTRAMIS